MTKFEYKRLSKILKEKNSSVLTYADLLSTLEWKEFRDKIVKRDNNECQKCGEKTNTLAWELKGSAPFDIFIRKASELEKKHLNDDIIYSSEHIVINAHHKYYINGKYPWEYNDDALISVCSKCHSKIHETEDILIYENENLENYKIAENCIKCNGTGYLGKYHYFMNGVCFHCKGKGITE